MRSTTQRTVPHTKLPAEVLSIRETLVKEDLFEKQKVQDATALRFLLQMSAKQVMHLAEQEKGEFLDLMTRGLRADHMLNPCSFDVNNVALVGSTVLMLQLQVLKKRQARKDQGAIRASFGEKEPALPDSIPPKDPVPQCNTRRSLLAIYHGLKPRYNQPQSAIGEVHREALPRT